MPQEDGEGLITVRTTSRRPYLRGLAVTATVLAAAALPVGPVAANTATVAAAPAAAAAVVPVAASEVRNYAWFNTKAESGDMHKGLGAHVARLINATPSGATLSLTLYFFNRREVLDALKGAAARGVKVRIVINGSQVWDGDAYYKALKATSGITVVECGTRRPDGQSTRGCMTDRTDAKTLKNPPLLHDKFMTISSVRLAGGTTARNVLYVSSANLDHYAAYENAITISHAGLYADYLRYFNGLMAHGRSGASDDNAGRTYVAGEHRLYTFPRREGAGSKPTSGSNDPIVSILKGLSCSGSTKVDLANFRIQRRAVVNELIAARKRGCQVRVVTGAKSGARHDEGTPMAALVTLATAMPVHLCGYTPAGGIPLHEKFLIIRQGSRSTLYVGSHNLTYRALRQNDENILALRNHPLATPFQQRFELHYSTCLQWHPPAGVAGTVSDTDQEATA
ncbi:phosphatidylserine/phosphatidylglycerophosphate/cardiolipin synthase family protein [Micromonospora sp. NPDC050495]|uniref:phosphatidylserine/phosphatidylglycerophosphate/ cardiolipin synthase family protein n=1 Tax=Micromonospora sp. NPDC050495 TaxID=3154936 RepID=UPI0033C4D660